MLARSMPPASFAADVAGFACAAISIGAVVPSAVAISSRRIPISGSSYVEMPKRLATARPAAPVLVNGGSGLVWLGCRGAVRGGRAGTGNRRQFAEDQAPGFRGFGTGRGRAKLFSGDVLRARPEYFLKAFHKAFDLLMPLEVFRTLPVQSRHYAHPADRCLRHFVPALGASASYDLVYTSQFRAVAPA